MSEQTTGWPARFAELRTADGEEWDRLHERIEAEWKRDYRAHFVEFAVSRRWERESAEDWAAEIVGDAFVSAAPDDPCATAEVDVEVCEREYANAD